MELLFATQNAHKLTEIQDAVGSFFEIKNLNDYNFTDDIPETKETIEENALQKAQFIYDKFGVSCFADDTGLEIEALNGEPGVYSARYAGEEKSAEANMQKVLKKMIGETNRKARFKTVISLIINKEEYQFTGIIEGEIIGEPAGNSGFGYDPIFRPNGYTETFAQLSLQEKNKISHRARATMQLISFLKENFQ